MTLRSITTPYDAHTLTEFRDHIGTLIGVPYASWNSALATEFNRFIEDAHEHVAKKFGHEPWMIQTWASQTLASGTATVSMPVYVRTVVAIEETYGGQTRRVSATTKAEYVKAWGTGSTSHPWNSQTDPKWFFDGVTDDNPPQYQWKRVPTPDATVTFSVLHRPYLSLIGSDSYNHGSQALATAALKDYICFRVLLYLGMFERAQQFRQAFEGEMRLNLDDATEGAWEAPRAVEEPYSAWLEAAGP